jgi:hypothetical protein
MWQCQIKTLVWDRHTIHRHLTTFSLGSMDFHSSLITQSCARQLRILSLYSLDLELPARFLTPNFSIQNLSQYSLIIDLCCILFLFYFWRYTNIYQQPIWAYVRKNTICLHVMIWQTILIVSWVIYVSENFIKCSSDNNIL